MYLKILSVTATKYKVAYANREMLYCTSYHTRKKIFYDGNSYGLQKEFEVYRFVRTS